jgi:hypothetical protein
VLRTILGRSWRDKPLLGRRDKVVASPLGRLRTKFRSAKSTIKGIVTCVE